MAFDGDTPLASAAAVAPHVMPLAISLSLRLFGNVFGGTIMVSLIMAMFRPTSCGHRTFFARLTILYFSQATEPPDEHRRTSVSGRSCSTRTGQVPTSIG
ncbi:hypothetical protein [Kutzneria sp. CA-103260]|uniref:hypothetical protein n=1 Tax=Kutzneria sp. CA-103260 TaxID=2802641 RepID=UPI001BAC617A|nr:hypothetical protein [Kutzneria sp. CA-103260]QUQ67134.1 ATP synthase subunit a [Kutzneria sp. CA-103260]